MLSINCCNEVSSFLTTLYRMSSMSASDASRNSVMLVVFLALIRLIGPISLMSAKKTANIIEFLESSLADIEDMRYKVVKKEDTSLQQLIDNIVELYLTTLYKLKFLA